MTELTVTLVYSGVADLTFLVVVAMINYLFCHYVVRDDDISRAQKEKTFLQECQLKYKMPDLNIAETANLW